MSKSGDVFGIHGYQKFVLILRPLASLVIVGILVWAVSQPNMGFKSYGPFILIGLIAWTAWEVFQLTKWIGCEVQVSDQSIRVGNKEVNWTDIESGTAKTAFEFQTFIELVTKDGQTLIIPGCIQQSGFILSAVEKNFPALVKKG